MIYAIDPGHGCPPDTGAVGIGIEERMNLDVANLLMAKLKAIGHIVFNVRPTSATTVRDSLDKRILAAKNHKAQLYVSIHFNAFDKKANGSEVFAISTVGKSYAAKVQAELVKLGYANRGVKDGSKLIVVKNSAMPAILIEGCFIDSVKDMKIYSAEKIATAIFNGIK